MKAAKANYYVTMTDKFMSGWGNAEGKTNKLIFLCDSLKQAEIVETNAKARGDQKYINITSRFPYHLDKPDNFVQVKTIEKYPSWYVAGYFSYINLVTGRQRQ